MTIDVYTWPTPNGHKVHIMLHEAEIAHNIIPINIQEGDQFKPDFLKISPNNKMPAIVDSDGPDGKPISVFESGACLIYLANKTGKFMPTDERKKYDVLQWLLSRIENLMDSMVYKVWYVLLYQSVSHPVSQIIRRSSGKVSQTRQEPRPSRRDRLGLVVHVPLRCRDRLVAKPLFDP